jgi:hypothetical protein
MVTSATNDRAPPVSMARWAMPPSHLPDGRLAPSGPDVAARRTRRPVASPAPSRLPPPPTPSTTDERLRRVRERKQSIERDVARCAARSAACLADVERLELEVRLRSEQLRETQLVLHRASEQMDATASAVRELDASVAQARPSWRPARAPSTRWASSPTCACCSPWSSRRTCCAATGS